MICSPRQLGWFALLGLLSGVCTLTGCGRGPDTVMAPNTAAEDPLPSGAYPEIVLLDGLERVFVKEGAGILPRPEGASPSTPLAVRATIRSIVDRTTPIEYRFMFFGPNDQPLTTNPTWRQLTIAARVRRVIEANAMRAGAVRFELEIRRPH